MFGITKDQLENGLENVRSNLCAYSHWRCDCKYGVEKREHFMAMTYGENTGCPEVRMAASLIHAMTDDEFQEMCKRANIVNPDEIFFKPSEDEALKQEENG